MSLVAQVAAVAAGLIHIMIFTLESVLFRRPSVRATFGVAAADVPAVRPWAFNQGFYNLFLAAGALGGLVVLHVGSVSAGRGLVAFACGSMLAAAFVLIATNRRMIRPAIVQGLAPLIALVFIAL
jgi:putative membrane protein